MITTAKTKSLSNLIFISGMMYYRIPDNLIKVDIVKVEKYTNIKLKQI